MSFIPFFYNNDLINSTPSEVGEFIQNLESTTQTSEQEKKSLRHFSIMTGRCACVINIMPLNDMCNLCLLWGLELRNHTLTLTPSYFWYLFKINVIEHVKPDREEVLIRFSIF